MVSSDCLDHLVGGRLDPGVTGGEDKFQAVLVVVLGEVLHRMHRAVEGFGLVIVEEHQHRRQGAIVVVQAVGAGDGVVQHIRVARQGFPFQVALVHALDHLLGHRHQ